MAKRLTQSEGPPAELSAHSGTGAESSAPSGTGAESSAHLGTGAAAEGDFELSSLETLSNDVQKTFDLHTGFQLEMQIAADEAALLKTQVTDLQSQMASATSQLWVHCSWLKKALRELRDLKRVVAKYEQNAAP